MANDFAICLYTDGIGALTTLGDLGMLYPYKPAYAEPDPEYSGDSSPIIDGWDRIVWEFPSLSAAQVAVLKAYKNKHVYIKTLVEGQYVTREAWLTKWAPLSGGAPLRTRLVLTFEGVRAVI